ncbi:TlpA family protein disulfide reductase [Polaribacter sp. MSW13]|uniref:TlpA family protein disulfide reductase n=1 Tax=Polaribacter marinus TaxID=2916838 RepID=A0A9X2AJA6_9FLAO|nr:TlpA disulfide reductase family protein [Polaribacter marinus]MCI2229331.1 TlpA family protein disulfide reductase [Polaribacter marinus]
MMKKAFLILTLIMICFSCKKNKQIKKSEIAKETTDKYINFNKYTFNTINKTKEKVSLSEGKKYILDFWYLECAPCVKQHKQLQEYQNQLLKNDIEIIGISIDRSQKNWREYLVEHQYNWKNYNQFNEENDLKNDLDIKLFPTYYYVDGKGVIFKKFNSFQKAITYLNLEISL